MLAVGVFPVVLTVVPQPSSAALSLALPRSDYPHGARIAPRPATNGDADVLLGPAHRSSFEQLRRQDGQGWLQAALWQFKTGRGAVAQEHQTIWGYGINVFKTRAQAGRALADVKIPTRKYRVAHLSALLYQSSDVRETLVFVFFSYRNIEVENYYEYAGVAPTRLAQSLRHIFSRQSSHLAHYARLLSRALHQEPTPTDTPSPTLSATPAPTLTPTFTPLPTSTPVATSTSSPSPTPSPTPTATPTGFQAQTSMAQSTYPPGSQAVVQVKVTLNEQPVAGAQMTATFYFGKSTARCSATTDATGTGSCLATVPSVPNGTRVYVQVYVAGPNGESATTSTSFTVQQTG